MRYKIFYILFVISALFYANYRLPIMNITPRNIMTFLMFILCVFEDRRIFLDKWFGVYLIFIACFGLSSALTGYFARFPRYLIGFFFVAYVGYWSTRILVLKYDGVRMFINLMIAIGVVNALVTIGQFNNIAFFADLPELLGVKVDDEFLDIMDVGEEAFGYNLPGLMASPVYNGYFVGVVGALSLYYQKDGLHLLKLIPWALMVVASFMVQQRGPFFILLLLSVFVLFKVVYSTKSRYRLVYTIFLIFLLPFGVSMLYSFLMGGQSRYNIGLEATGRDDIYVRTLAYIKENFFLGGKFKLSATLGFAPHNLFLNAWVYGGIFGFFAIVWLTIKQCVPVLRTAFNKVDPECFSYFVCGMAFLGFTLNSMLHNASVVSGDLIIWLLWGVFSTKTVMRTDTLGQQQNRMKPMYNYNLDY